MRSAEIMLEPKPASVGRARRWLSRQLEEWGLEDLDYDASVVLSELVTNAVLHARTSIELKVTHDQVFRIEVRDASDAMPSPRGPTASATTGRGLRLVAALATSWGYEPREAGKTVWAEFADVNVTSDSRSSGTSGHRSNVSVMEHRRADTDQPRLKRTA